MAQTDLTLSIRALAEVLETIVGKLNDLLLISELESDAVFAYMDESNLGNCYTNNPFLTTDKSATNARSRQPEPKCSRYKINCSVCKTNMC